MAMIKVSNSIDDGSMGDGWRDVTETAESFAAELKQTWAADLQEFANAGHTVEIDIDVLTNTTGGGGRFIYVVSEDGERDVDESAMKRAVESALTDETSAFEEFCCSDEAESLAA